MTSVSSTGLFTSFLLFNGDKGVGTFCRGFHIGFLAGGFTRVFVALYLVAASVIISVDNVGQGVMFFFREGGGTWRDHKVDSTQGYGSCTIAFFGRTMFFGNYCGAIGRLNYPFPWDT